MKCKFWKKCKLYDKDNPVCTEDGGLYYGWDRPAGCYRYNEEKERKKNEIY